MGKILCFFGFHDWIFNVEDIMANQNSEESVFFCSRCNKRMPWLLPTVGDKE